MSGVGLPLRPYQRQAVDAVHECHEAGVNRPATVIATGGGKTPVIAKLAEENPGRTLILAHRRELIDQTVAKVHAVAPDLTVGVEMAARTAGDVQVVVGSVQSMASDRRLARFARDAFDLVLVDECHHSLGRTYVDVMDHFGCYREAGGTRSGGYTATLARGDGIGLGSVWQTVAFRKSIIELIVEGYLVNPRGISVQVDVDLASVRTSGGEYVDAALGQALTDAHFEKVVVEAYLAHGNGWPGIVFTPTVATAQSAARALSEAGVRAEAVWGEMDPAARRAAVDGLGNGELDLLCNCNVLTEGTDIPRARVAIMARPTRSAPLYVQMAGRVLRVDPADPGKTNALLIDLVGATTDHRLASLVDLAEGELGRKPEKARAEEGESLTEAVERIQEVKLGAARNVDLFGASASVWLQTSAGFWFVPAGGGHVALLPGPGGAYAIALFPPGSAPPTYSGAIPDLTLAMALGEEHARAADTATGRGFSSVSRAAGWRSRQPTDKQIAFAARMGIIAAAPGARMGEVSDLIEKKIASRRIDRHLTRTGAPA